MSDTYSDSAKFLYQDFLDISRRSEVMLRERLEGLLESYEYPQGTKVTNPSGLSARYVTKSGDGSSVVIDITFHYNASAAHDAQSENVLIRPTLDLGDSLHPDDLATLDLQAFLHEYPLDIPFTLFEDEMTLEVAEKNAADVVGKIGEWVKSDRFSN